MKYLITEKQNCIAVFIEAEKLESFCTIADFLEDTHSGCVLEVTHNFTAQQGSIILKKLFPDFPEKIKKLIESYE